MRPFTAAMHRSVAGATCQQPVLSDGKHTARTQTAGENGQRLAAVRTTVEREHVLLPTDRLGNARRVRVVKTSR